MKKFSQKIFLYLPEVVFFIEMDWKVLRSTKMSDNGMLSNFQGVKLYHYTDFSALNGIIKNCELWLCNVLTMNDLSEMRYFMDLMRQLVMRKEGVDTAKAWALFETQMERLKEMPVFAASLSQLVDDAGQWERYGAEGKGVCIEFNAEILNRVIDTYASLQRVFYVQNIEETEHVGAIVRYLQDPKDLGKWESIEALFDNAWARSSAFKHVAFSNEREVRIMSVPLASDAAFSKQSLGQLKYSVSRYGLREYYAVPFAEKPGKMVEGLITGVYIGPRSPISEDMIRRFIESLGTVDVSKVTIKRSDCPLR